ncbi:hypothetical protein EMCG_03909 [[Emmonsia] crescens]|uniref:Uncharacterized protein n=1 Tax=[Emmonsia] crescens TaxID=73230 RepID=A0A0G2HTX3_9EURO|nr:hypothetical protein EMCG_03909 [Emmonsia crescens UAMH 3008]
MCVPNLNVQMGDDEDFHLNAVTQVVAFTLHALASSPLSQAWHDAAVELGVWPVEYADVLAQTLKGPLACLSRQEGCPAYEVEAMSAD